MQVRRAELWPCLLQSISWRWTFLFILPLLQESFLPLMLEQGGAAKSKHKVVLLALQDSLLTKSLLRLCCSNLKWNTRTWSLGERRVEFPLRSAEISQKNEPSSVSETEGKQTGQVGPKLCPSNSQSVAGFSHFPSINTKFFPPWIQSNLCPFVLENEIILKRYREDSFPYWLCYVFPVTFVHI